MFVVLMQLGICMVFLNYSAENLMAVDHYYLSNENVTCLIPSNDDKPPFRARRDVEVEPFGPQKHKNETSCNADPAATFTKEQLVFMVTPAAWALSLGRSAMLITISTTMATLIMSV